MENKPNILSMQIKPNIKYEHVYAILRYDNYRIYDLKELEVENIVTVVKILRTFEKAKKEVERLNKINADKQCKYFLQLARLEREQNT